MHALMYLYNGAKIIEYNYFNYHIIGLKRRLPPKHYDETLEPRQKQRNPSNKSKPKQSQTQKKKQWHPSKL